MMEKNTKSEKFNFFIPVDKELQKGKDKEGKDVYYFEGLASDGTIDSDNETMRDCIFDTDEFKFVNWDHEKGPANIIGAPIEWDKRKGYLFVKGALFPSVKKGKETIDLMEALKLSPNKSSRLGISIEGEVTERDLINTKKIKRAKIKAIALCPYPKNGNTWAELVQKSFSGEGIYKSKNDLEFDMPTEDFLARFYTQDGRTEITLDNDCNIIVKSLDEKKTAPLKEESLDDEITQLMNRHKTGEISLTDFYKGVKEVLRKTMSK